MNTAVHKASNTILDWTERGLVPDNVVRAGIRRLCRERLSEIRSGDIEASGQLQEDLIALMNRSDIALIPDAVNEQHYEVPTEFFGEVLGRHAKYSCCYWNEGTETLDQAEAHSLRITCERAGIEDGMSILDLGCGWGSLSLWIATHFPGCKVTSVSNSALQGKHIRALALRRKLTNIEVITRDMNHFEATQRYDRIVSVEMFEHMRNYREMFFRLSRWLKPEGKFFMHIFCHRSCAYEFLDKGPSDWMGRHFFSGGIMPSDDLPLRFQEQLRLLRQDRWSGTHYETTANAWLQNMDDCKDRIMPILAQTYGEQHAERWFQRWRIFFMACAELFGYADGQEWYVSHYLFGLSDHEQAGADRC
jgi:cyclopropane-fatty-acyl-phospholipid synthase